MHMPIQKGQNGNSNVRTKSFTNWKLDEYRNWSPVNEEIQDNSNLNLYLRFIFMDKSGSCVCVCKTHKDIEVRMRIQILYSHYCAGHMFILRHLLQVRPCYINFLWSFFLSWMGLQVFVHQTKLWSTYHIIMQFQQIFLQICFQALHQQEPYLAKYISVSGNGKLFSKLSVQYSSRALCLSRGCCNFKTKRGCFWTKQFLKVLTNHDPSLIIQTSAPGESVCHCA